MNALTIAFLEWARTKPAGERYNPVDSMACALAQFGQATDHPELLDRSGTAFLFGDRELLSAVYPSEGHTFGGLVARLEALCPETPITRSDWSRLDAYMTDLVSA